MSQYDIIKVLESSGKWMSGPEIKAAIPSSGTTTYTTLRKMREYGTLKSKVVISTKINQKIKLYKVNN